MVPPIAELKMLRDMQGKVNKRTQSLYDALQASKRTELNRVQQRILQRVTSAQENIHGLLEELNQALTEQAEAMQTEGEGEGNDGDGDGGDGEKKDGGQ